MAWEEGNLHGEVARMQFGLVLVLEGDLDLGAVGDHLAVVELQVHLDDLGDAQLAQ